MAFQSVNKQRVGVTKEAVKLTDLDTGVEVVGYPLAFIESKKYPGTYSIVMQDQAGDRFYVNTAGNVKYAIEDGRIKLNTLTKLIRQPDQKNKNGKMTSNFEILQDSDYTIEGTTPSENDSFNAISSSTTATSADIKGSSAATKQAVERASVKAQAQKLQAQVSGQKR